MNKWMDITIGIQDGMVHWPGDADVIITKPVNMKDGADANVTNISLSAHTGTHIDAPLHFIKDGKDVCQIDTEKFIGEALVIDTGNERTIGRELLEKYSLKKGDRVLFRTRNSSHQWVQAPFMEDYTYLSTPAAEYLVETGVIAVGIDYLSIAGEENGLAVHRLLLKNEILIIEGLNLRDVVPGKYEFICLPMKIEGSDGAPARVFIRKRE